MKETCKRLVQFFANPRLVLCFLMAWFLTNGWSYVLFALGNLHKKLPRLLKL